MDANKISFFHSIQFLLVAVIAIVSLSTKADISESIRNDKAVVLYRFQETTGNILDSGNAKFGAPAPLSIKNSSAVVRAPGVLDIQAPTLIRSLAPVEKLTNACKASKGMTLEVWLENHESVEKRSGMDGRKDQPLRIVSFSKGLRTRNFLLGQFYDMGNLYEVAINTSGTENDSTRLGGSMTDPLTSKTSAIIIPDPNSERVVSSYQQKVITTLSAEGIARLYLSDRNGNMYLAETSTRGFSGSAATYFDTWRAGNYITLGNEYMSDADYDNYIGQPAFFATCTTADCLKNPNRYWKGKLFLVAVYCEALSKEDIFGGKMQEMTNNIYDVDPNLSLTPNLKKAQDIYQRITSSKTPIVNPVLSQMEKMINAGDLVGAAGLATQDANFYNITVKDFAARMSNRDETINVPLNDFTATIIGAVRDNINAQKLLTDNITYVADPTKSAVPSDWVDDLLQSNNHYEALSNGRYDLSKVLVQKTQKLFNGKAAVDNPTPAGLLTSRQWLAAHAIAGTNRRPVEYSLKEFLCTPLEKAADSSGPDNVVGRDIDRFPGGSHTKYTTTCRACHTIMDGFRPAFANFTFSNNFVKNSLLVPSIGMNDDEATSTGMIQNPPYIAKKLNHNETVFPEGRITVDDNWVNNANRGANVEQFGWTKTAGKGIQEFGRLLAESKAYPQCLSKRVFKSVCKREPSNTEVTTLNKIAEEFATKQNYNIRFLFQKIVTTPECLGGN